MGFFAGELHERPEKRELRKKNRAWSREMVLCIELGGKSANLPREEKGEEDRDVESLRRLLEKAVSHIRFHRGQVRTQGDVSDSADTWDYFRTPRARREVDLGYEEEAGSNYVVEATPWGTKATDQQGKLR